MSPAPPQRGRQDAAQVLTILLVVLGAAFALFVVFTVTSLRNFGIIAALACVGVGGILSGNARLYSLWGLMLTIPLNLSKRFGPNFIGKPGGEDSFRVEVSDIFLFALAAFLIWDLVTGKRKGIRVPKLTMAWLALIGIGLVWILIGPWRTTAAHEVMRMTKVTILFLTIVNTVDSPKKVWHCCAGIAVGGLIQGSIGLIQYFKKGLIGLEVLGETTEATILVLEATSVQGAGVFRPSALLQHANLMGMFLAVVIPLAIALIITSRKPVGRGFFIATVAVASPGVVISLSRSAWVSAFLAVVVVLAILPLHPRLRWRSFRVSGAVGLVGIVVMLALAGPIVQRAFNSKNDSSVAREIYKADARKMIAASPWVGHGLNSYTFELPKYTSISMRTYGGNLPSVHHIFYLWWAETGIVGMLLFCTVWASIIWVALMNLSVKDELLFAVNAACLAVMVCLIPDAFLSFTLRVNTMLRMFWLVAGLILAIRYMRRKEVGQARVRAAARARATVERPDALTHA